MDWGEEPFLSQSLKDFFLLRSLFRFCLSRLQWNLYIGTPLFKGHLHSRDTKIWCRKNVHIIFVTVTSIERTPLFRERDTFVGPKAQVLLPFSSVPINAHVCVFCNQKSKRTHASLSARVSDTHKDIFATILEIPTCFIN